MLGMEQHIHNGDIDEENRCGKANKGCKVEMVSWILLAGKISVGMQRTRIWVSTQEGIMDNPLRNMCQATCSYGTLM